MPSVRETILAAIATALNAAPPVGVPAVNRGRITPFEQTELPMYTFYPLDGDSTPIGNKHSVTAKKSLNVRFDIYGSGSIIEQIADPIYIHIIKTMMAGNVSEYIDYVLEGKTDWEVDQGDTIIGVCHQDITIEYHASIKDPSVNNA